MFDVGMFRCGIIDRRSPDGLLVSCEELGSEGSGRWVEYIMECIQYYPWITSPYKARGVTIYIFESIFIFL